MFEEWFDSSRRTSLADPNVSLDFDRELASVEYLRDFRGRERPAFVGGTMEWFA